MARMTKGEAYDFLDSMEPGEMEAALYALLSGEIDSAAFAALRPFLLAVRDSVINSSEDC